MSLRRFRARSLPAVAWPDAPRGYVAAPNRLRSPVSTRRRAPLPSLCATSLPCEVRADEPAAQ